MNDDTALHPATLRARLLHTRGFHLACYPLVPPSARVHQIHVQAQRLSIAELQLTMGQILPAKEHLQLPVDVCSQMPWGCCSVSYYTWCQHHPEEDVGHSHGAVSAASAIDHHVDGAVVRGARADLSQLSQLVADVSVVLVHEGLCI